VGVKISLVILTHGLAVKLNITPLTAILNSLNGIFQL